MVNKVFVATNKRLVMATITATAGNVVTAITPPANLRYRLLYGRILLACDATVQNRYVNLFITDSTGALVRTYFVTGATAITASQTLGMSIQTIVTGAVSVAGVVNADKGIIGVGESAIVEGTDHYRIYIQQGQAGDSYTGYLVFEVEATLW